jgi:hypothetical protein
VAVGKPVKGFAAQELLSDLALELDAVCAVLGRGLPSFESRLDRQFCLGGTMFSAQYRQRLVPPDGNLVRRGWFRCLFRELGRDDVDLSQRSAS